MKHQQLYPSLFILCSLLLISCGPVHRFTRVKKVPREYSLNYCVEGQKAPRSDINRQPWIVYSDRAENSAYNKAGGKVEAKQVEYLEPLLVIGKKGKFEYLKLIKYTPDIIQNGKLDYKKAEYYGWMPKDNLLLDAQAVTDIQSGKKNKTLVAFSDTLTLPVPQKYFSNDSIISYQDLDTKTPAQKITPFSVVYRLKTNKDQSKVLISKVPILDPEKVKEDVCGWVDASLIQDIGTGLHADMNVINKANTHFFIKKGVYQRITQDMTESSQLLADQYKTLKYNPVNSYSHRDSLAVFRTRIAQPLLDYSNNYVFNVNGKPISYRKYRRLSQELKHISVTVVVEGKEDAIADLPQIVNALQNLQEFFEQEKENGKYQFKFNCVIGVNDVPTKYSPISTGFTEDYSDIVDFLSEKVTNQRKLSPIQQIYNSSWASLRKAVDMLPAKDNSTNILIVTGNKRDAGGVDSLFVNELVDKNCRILGFQSYAGLGDDYNNFVLDIEDMINGYAYKQLKERRNIQVSPEQIRRENRYRKISEDNNSYMLDFPERSITQGGLFFASKGESLPLDYLTNHVDTLMQEVQADNESLLDYLSKAFRTVGNNRTRYDSLFLANYRMDSLSMPPKKLVNNFINETPGWYIPSYIGVINDSLNQQVDYYLMLSEVEMKDLKSFISSLSEIEVDYVKDVLKKERLIRKPCNCPEDALYEEIHEFMPAKTNPSDSIVTQEVEIPNGGYAGTKQARRHLVNVFIKPIKYCKLCNESKRKLLELTLAQAQYRITGSPTFAPILQNIKIKDIKDKKIISDETLEQLILYYKSKKSALDKAEQFESNGQIYYWVKNSFLP